MLAYCQKASSTLAPPRSQNTISSAIGAMRTAPDSPRCCRVPAPITSRAWQRTPRAASKLDRTGHLALVWLVEIHGVHQKDIVLLVVTTIAVATAEQPHLRYLSKRHPSFQPVKSSNFPPNFVPVELGLKAKAK